MQSVADDVNAGNGPVAGSMKRRGPSPDQDVLEINMPTAEPQSKKAARKSRKHNNLPTSEQSDPVGDQVTHGSDRKVGQSRAEDVASSSGLGKSTHSVWIGNLPFSMTKATLRNFLTTVAQPPIPQGSIIRIHIPAPSRVSATRTTLRPRNKGFSYVDFADHASFLAAMALSETQIAGRNVLIKDAKSFEGRPSQGLTVTYGDGPRLRSQKLVQKGSKPPSRRVFVGNLGFDVTAEKLSQLYSWCGKVSAVHVATFEDSGKCKGYAWVTFETTEIARAAVEGFVKVDKETRSDRQHTKHHTQNQPDDSYNQEELPPHIESRDKATKLHKQFVNRINGRSVRCEFAEDPAIRYKKRFAKESTYPPQGATSDLPSPEKLGDATEVVFEDLREDNGANHPFGLVPCAPTDASKRRGRERIKPLTNTGRGREEKIKEIRDKIRYRSGTITESTGVKISFD